MINALATILAIIGIGVSVVVILFCIIILIEKLRMFWGDRWEWARTILIRRMIVRFKIAGEYNFNDLKSLNRDIDKMNYIFQKYRLDEPYDKEERQFIHRNRHRNVLFESRR